MSDKDPIEELFRQQANESTGLEKPRGIVWQKIESNLQEKTKTPIKDFIQGIWFSAAVFALIAVPYFYFFIENMNIYNKNIEMVQSTVDELIIHDHNPSTNKKTEVLNKIEEENSPQIVYNNLPKKEEIKPKINHQTNENLAKNKDSILKDSDNIFPLNSPVYETKSYAKNKELDTVSAQMSMIPAAAKVASEAMDRNQDSIKKKTGDPLTIYTSRFTVQDNVNRASFEYIENTENQIVFSNGTIKLILIKENGQVNVLTSAKNLKAEILNVIKNNKDLLFNNYINYKKK